MYEKCVIAAHYLIEVHCKRPFVAGKGMHTLISYQLFSHNRRQGFGEQHYYYKAPFLGGLENI
jgi:hypothetical protein